MHLEECGMAELEAWAGELESRYRDHQALGLDLDLTRGKPGIEQLELSASLDGILRGNFRFGDGDDARGYGGLDGIPEAKALAAHWLGVRHDEVLIGGNSSLTLMYLFLLSAQILGLDGDESAPGSERFQVSLSRAWIR